MLTAALLGFLGSFGHCVGMCSGVMLLLNRHPILQRSTAAWAWVHLGRLLSYAGLGLIAGAAGQLLWTYAYNLPLIQGILAIIFALIAFYMALAFAGLLPSVDGLLSGLIQRWGAVMRGITGNAAIAPFAAGLLWGLLPCGLVLTALLNAAGASTALEGFVRMALFGISTVPSLVLMRWIAPKIFARTWTRPLAALVMMVFGFQFAMRGFASLGWLGHAALGEIILW